MGAPVGQQGLRGSGSAEVIAVFTGSTAGLEQALGRVEKSFGSSSSAIAGFVGAISFVRVIREINELAAEAVKFGRIEAGFEALADKFDLVSTEIISDIQEVTQGQIATVQAMESVNKALTLLPPAADRLVELTTIATGAAAALGLDVAKAFDDITTGIGRASPKILDNLGIIVNAREAYAAYADELDKSVGSLTGVEKQIALLNQVIDRNIDRFGAIAAAVDPDVFQQTAALFKDLRIEIGNLLAENIVPLLEDVNDLLGDTDDKLERIAGQVVSIGTLLGSAAITLALLRTAEIFTVITANIRAAEIQTQALKTSIIEIQAARAALQAGDISGAVSILGVAGTESLIASEIQLASVQETVVISSKQVQIALDQQGIAAKNLSLAEEQLITVESAASIVKKELGTQTALNTELSGRLILSKQFEEAFTIKLNAQKELSLLLDTKISAATGIVITTKEAQKAADIDLKAAEDALTASKERLVAIENQLTFAHNRTTAALRNQESAAKSSIASTNASRFALLKSIGAFVAITIAITAFSRLLQEVNGLIADTKEAADDFDRSIRKVKESLLDIALLQQQLEGEEITLFTFQKGLEEQIKIRRAAFDQFLKDNKKLIEGNTEFAKSVEEIQLLLGVGTAEAFESASGKIIDFERVVGSSEKEISKFKQGFLIFVDSFVEALDVLGSEIINFRGETSEFALAFRGERGGQFGANLSQGARDVAAELDRLRITAIGVRPAVDELSSSFQEQVDIFEENIEKIKKITEELEKVSLATDIRFDLGLDDETAQLENFVGNLEDAIDDLVERLTVFRQQLQLAVERQRELSEEGIIDPDVEIGIKALSQEIADLTVELIELNRQKELFARTAEISDLGDTLKDIVDDFELTNQVIEAFDAAAIFEDADEKLSALADNSRSTREELVELIVTLQSQISGAFALLGPFSENVKDIVVANIEIAEQAAIDAGTTVSSELARIAASTQNFIVRIFLNLFSQLKAAQEELTQIPIIRAPDTGDVFDPLEEARELFQEFEREIITINARIAAGLITVFEGTKNELEEVLNFGEDAFKKFLEILDDEEEGGREAATAFIEELERLALTAPELFESGIRLAVEQANELLNEFEASAARIRSALDDTLSGIEFEEALLAARGGGDLISQQRFAQESLEATREALDIAREESKVAGATAAGRQLITDLVQEEKDLINDINILEAERATEIAEKAIAARQEEIDKVKELKELLSELKADRLAELKDLEAKALELQKELIQSITDGLKSITESLISGDLASAFRTAFNLLGDELARIIIEKSAAANEGVATAAAFAQAGAVGAAASIAGIIISNFLSRQRRQSIELATPLEVIVLNAIRIQTPPRTRALLGSGATIFSSAFRDLIKRGGLVTP